MSVLIEASSDGYTLMSRVACDVPYANTPSSAGVRVLIIVVVAYSLKYYFAMLLFFYCINDLCAVGEHREEQCSFKQSTFSWADMISSDILPSLRGLEAVAVHGLLTWL